MLNETFSVIFKHRAFTVLREDNFTFFIAKYETPSDVLENELYQLGLPKEHANALCKIYTKVRTTLEQKLIHQSLQCNRKQVTFQPQDSKIVCTIRYFELLHGV